MLARKNLIRYTNILFTIYVITLLVCSIFFFFRIRVMESTFDSINRTVEVKLNLEKTLSSLRDAETAQRGFLLTRDMLFLDHYGEAHQTVFEAIEKLRVLTADRPVQQRNTAILAEIARRRFERLKHTMESKDFETADANTKREHLMKGRQVMIEARELIERMNRIEDQALEEKRKKKEDAKELTPLYILGIFVFSLLVIIACYVIMIRHRQTNVTTKIQERAKAKTTARF